MNIKALYEQLSTLIDRGYGMDECETYNPKYDSDEVIIDVDIDANGRVVFILER